MFEAFPLRSDSPAALPPPWVSTDAPRPTAPISSAHACPPPHARFHSMAALLSDSSLKLGGRDTGSGVGLGSVAVESTDSAFRACREIRFAFAARRRLRARDRTRRCIGRRRLRHFSDRGGRLRSGPWAVAGSGATGSLRALSVAAADWHGSVARRPSGRARRAHFPSRYRRRREISGARRRPAKRERQRDRHGGISDAVAARWRRQLVAASRDDERNDGLARRRIRDPRAAQRADRRLAARSTEHADRRRDSGHRRRRRRGPGTRDSRHARASSPRPASAQGRSRAAARWSRRSAPHAEAIVSRRDHGDREGRGSATFAAS